jgi:hypothetical protein
MLGIEFTMNREFNIAKAIEIINQYGLNNLV